jgi:hypothetical protein
MKYLSACVLLLALGACATTNDDGWEDWGGFTLAENALAVHHRVREGQHRLDLLRRTETRGGDVRWETLDTVNLDLGEGTLVCLTAKRDGSEGDYVAVAEDDADHRHPVLRAWRVDTATRKLVSENAAGVQCNAKEEPRTR